MTDFSRFETQVMRRLLSLAKRRKGLTSPNPVTAAAVIRNGSVIAEGVHAGPGQPHAEVVALEKAGKLAKGATVMVNLEPCTHWGKTPPCVEALIKAKVSRVIYAIGDPNPLVQNAPARATLEANGIEVDDGLLRDEALELNEVFFKTMIKKRPFVTLKAGVSLDGRIALSNGQSKYITSERSIRKVHQLRAQHDALLVGGNTLLRDDPSLNVRFGRNRDRLNPTKLILAPNENIKKDLNIFQANPKDKLILLADNDQALPNWTEQKMTIWRFAMSNGQIKWTDLLKRCLKYNLTSILIEGGSQIYSSALESDIVDKLYFYMAPKLLSGEKDIPVFATSGVKSLTQVCSLEKMAVKYVNPDIEIKGYLCHPSSYFPTK